MTSEEEQEAVELLRQLGLKKYESKCFVALTRLPQGIAKGVSEIVDVPRTRVYDAVRVLEAEGLVEIQHTSPRQFRALGVDEAIQTLEGRYEERLTHLQESLESIESSDRNDRTREEVWSLTGSETIAARTNRIVE